MYGFTNRVELADSSATDSFEVLTGHLELPEAVSLLQELGVDDDKLRGLVCANALRQAGLD